MENYSRRLYIPRPLLIIPTSTNNPQRLMPHNMMHIICLYPLGGLRLSAEGLPLVCRPPGGDLLLRYVVPETQ